MLLLQLILNVICVDFLCKIMVVEGCISLNRRQTHQAQ